MLLEEGEFAGIDDPLLWEEYLSAGGATSVSCEADATGYDSYTITEEPPDGLEWVTVALLTDTSAEDGLFGEYFLPAVGEELFLYETDAQGPTVPVDVVILCSGDASQWVGFGDPTDPAFWEDVLAEAPEVTDISCATEDVGADSYTVTGAPPAGADWLMLVLLADFEADGGRYDGWFWEEFLPETGVEYVLPDPLDASFDDESVDGPTFEATLPIHRVILCSAQLPDGFGDDDGGEPIGPPVETDVPAPPERSSGGVFAALAAAALVTGAVLLSLRRSDTRR